MTAPSERFQDPEAMGDMMTARYVAMLKQMVDELTQELHKVHRFRIYETSGEIALELRALRARINLLRARAGLGESPLRALYESEETP